MVLIDISVSVFIAPCLTLSWKINNIIEIKIDWRPLSLNELAPRKISIKGVPGISVLRAC